MGTVRVFAGEIKQTHYYIWGIYSYNLTCEFGKFDLDNVIVEKCEAYGNGIGFHILDSEDVVIRASVSHNNSSNGFDFGNCVSSLIENSASYENTGNGVVLNTSLNRRGEPVVCTPEDALNMFFSCDLEYLVLENILVQKKQGK